jgi:tetratricopeptide (TPR) repeat protein
MSATYSVTAGEFTAEVNRASDTYFKEARAKAEVLLQEGKVDEANETYLSARADQDLTPADCFLLGNVFFKIAPELAIKYQGRAYAALPENPDVNLEWAMILHRQGKTKEAAGCYLKSIAAHAEHYLPHALLADCLIREGDLKGAVEHWNKARHPNNHTGIDFAICEIYGPLSPHLRHYEITKAVANGETSRVEEMIDLATSWNQDWWNAELNQAALKRSLDLAAKSLAGDAKRLAELRLYVSTCDQDKAGPVEGLREKLIGAKLIIGPDSSLPVSNLVAERLCAMAMEQKLVTKRELLDRFEAELRRRSIDAKSGDVIALNLLAALLLPDDENDKANAEKLAAVNLVGWERFHDVRFAASYLVSALVRNELNTHSPLLQKALKEFPDDPWICEIAIKMAANEGVALRPYLVSSIKAEFRHLSVSMGIIKDSYRLKSLFATLEQRL